MRIVVREKLFSLEVGMKSTVVDVGMDELEVVDRKSLKYNRTRWG